MSWTIHLAAAARADIVDILEHSEREFGPAGRERYANLMATALRDISEAPDRPGSAIRSELGDNIRSWHLRLSRERARSGDGGVRRPRHLVVYTVIGDATVGVLRVLHDAMELHRHLGEGIAFAPDDNN